MGVVEARNFGLETDLVVSSVLCQMIFVRCGSHGTEWVSYTAPVVRKNNTVVRRIDCASGELGIPATVEQERYSFDLGVAVVGAVATSSHLRAHLLGVRALSAEGI